MTSQGFQFYGLWSIFSIWQQLTFGIANYSLTSKVFLSKFIQRWNLFFQLLSRGRGFAALQKTAEEINEPVKSISLVAASEVFSSSHAWF